MSGLRLSTLDRARRTGPSCAINVPPSTIVAATAVGAGAAWGRGGRKQLPRAARGEMFRRGGPGRGRAKRGGAEFLAVVNQFVRPADSDIALELDGTRRIGGGGAIVPLRRTC